MEKIGKLFMTAYENLMVNYYEVTFLLLDWQKWLDEMFVSTQDFVCISWNTTDISCKIKD